MHLILASDHVMTPAIGDFSRTWHGLDKHPENSPEIILKDGSNVPEVFCPIIQVGLKPDIDSPVASVSAETAEELGTADFSKWKVLLADLRENGGEFTPIHVHGAGYAIHQNRDLFDSSVSALSEVVGSDGFEIATVGTLGNYSQFFLSVYLKENAGFDLEGDKHSQFFNLNTSHNGMIGSSFLLSVVRMVCWNTVNFAIQDAEKNGTRSKIKHSKFSAALITPERIEEQVKAWLVASDAHRNFLAAAKRQAMNSDQFKAFAAGVFSNEKSDQLSSVSFNRITELENLFRTGRGNKGASAFDAFQAFTDYFSNGDGLGRDSSDAKRVASANFGRGNEWKLEALRVLSNEEEFSKATKRGEVLFSDKLKVQELAIAG